jgi:uncharacterized membrane protein YccC
VGPPLLFGLRLWASVCLALYVTFWLQLENGFWAGTSAALVCQPHLGASLRKGWHRMIGTIIGAVAIVVLTGCFPQQRAPFLVGLALWGAASAFVATLFRNFAAYAAALAGYTAAIIASDQLGATGGPNGDAFMLAVTRVSEIGIGILCAGVVLAGTDYGGARRVLARRFAALSAAIAARFTAALARRRPEPADAQRARRELIGDVVALDPIIDEAIGESSEIREHSSALQAGVNGLFAALAGWRTVAVRLDRLGQPTACGEVDAILDAVPHELRAVLEADEPTRWMAVPGRVRDHLVGAARSFAALPAGTPSLRLLADQTARVFAGLAAALHGLGLLVWDVEPAPSPRRDVRLVVPDWLPALVNGGRAFVTIGAVELFWIATAWPNGALAVTWAAITVTIYATHADAAYVHATAFIAGNTVATVFAAIIAFGALPAMSTFAGFSLVVGLYLVPAGVLMAWTRSSLVFAAMAGNLVPFLAPTNDMTYDPAQFANTAIAILGGSGVAALAFRLLPPLSPAFRAARLVALTSRDLRNLAIGPVPGTPAPWERLVYARLSALPAEATLLQRGALVASLSVGIAIVHLRRAGAALGVTSDVDRALTAFARGDATLTSACFEQLDRRLAVRAGAVQARASVLGITEALTQYPVFFAGRA